MEEEIREETPVPEESPATTPPPAPQNKTWFPYITKTQFERFISRLEGKIPDEIDRDYMRGIIHTPSMIYRFLRGIEAMKLIDREQRPTTRLHRLIAQETRRQATAEILRDLYPDLMDQWDQTSGKITDRDVVSFFRKKTGMGNDSANKMKMFFKFLVSEADLGTPQEGPGNERPKPAQETAPPPPAAEAAPVRKPFQEKPAPAPRPSEAPLSQPQPLPSPPPDRGAPSPSVNGLSEYQAVYLETLQSVLKINIDGDWDDEMIRTVFDRLERLYDRIRRG